MTLKHVLTSIFLISLKIYAQFSGKKGLYDVHTILRGNCYIMIKKLSKLHHHMRKPKNRLDITICVNLKIDQISPYA